MGYNNSSTQTTPPAPRLPDKKRTLYKVSPLLNFALSPPVPPSLFPASLLARLTLPLVVPHLFPRMRWTPEAYLRLFGLTLSLNPIHVDYVKLAEAFGEGVTPKALTHKIAEIRNAGTAAVKAGEGEDGSGPAPAAGTPKKRKNRAGDGGGAEKRRKGD